VGSNYPLEVPPAREPVVVAGVLGPVFGPYQARQLDEVDMAAPVPVEHAVDSFPQLGRACLVDAVGAHLGGLQAVASCPAAG